MRSASSTYELVTANYGNDTEWFDAILLRIEGRARAIVSKNDVGVDFGIQIIDTNVIVFNDIFEASLGLGIAAATAPSIVAGAALMTIAIYVHVHELLAVAVEVDNARGVVFAVAEN